MYSFDSILKIDPFFIAKIFFFMLLYLKSVNGHNSAVSLFDNTMRNSKLIFNKSYGELHTYLLYSGKFGPIF